MTCSAGLAGSKDAAGARSALAGWWCDMQLLNERSEKASYSADVQVPFQGWASQSPACHCPIDECALGMACKEIWADIKVLGHCRVGMHSVRGLLTLSCLE